ncbi:MAG: hypothetical protein J6J26_12185 [Bacteroides sp.]|nr:hypothetical protein [Bacteroides sp.]
MVHNEYFRLKAEELLNRLKQVKTIVSKHNLTIGQIAEGILRAFLKEVCPNKVQVAQGFIYKDNNISTQCDIIIYDNLNYSPLFTWDDLIIIDSNAVLAVIEVKVSIREKDFNKTINDFELLRTMGVCNKFLFIYNAPLLKTLNNYFFPSTDNDSPIFSTNFKYDHDSYEKLPDAIVGLNKAYYLQKGYADGGRDMLGYNSLIWVDEENKEISCLEEFVSAILSIIAEYSNIPKSIMPTEHSENNMMSADISKCVFIPLFDM